MKCLVAALLALPCLTEPQPDIFSYSPFLGRYILSAEPGVPQVVTVAATRLYQPAYTWQNGPFGALLGRNIYTAGLGYQGISHTNIIPASSQSILPQAIPTQTYGVKPTSGLNAIPTSAQSILPPAIPSQTYNVRPTGGQNAIAAVPSKQKLLKVGELPERVPEMHPMKGSIYFNEENDSQIIVRGFYYPKAGPDAFFWAGEDEPSCSEESVGGRNYLLAPGKVGSTDYYNEAQPILPTYNGEQGDLVLTLPPGASVRNLKWLCVWCRKFAQNFGTVKINNP